jgi:hypothetical protein
MKNKRKLGFRIWVLFSIVLFLLIPLLSSPVAAINYCTGMSVTTTCGPTASPITITVTNPTTTTFNNDGSLTINITCDVTFQDLFTTTRIPSSDHDSTLSASVKTGSGNSPSDATGTVTLNDGEIYYDTLTIDLIATSLPTTWNVILDTWVVDKQSSDRLQITKNWEITLQ